LAGSSESSSQVRLRVGVIGLGRLWEARHKPALAKMRDRLRVTAVYDQVARRAEAEAAQLGCEASGGLRALIERPDVDVVYLLTPQWFGLYPIDLVCEARKPIYCALPLAGEPEERERIGRLVTSSGVPFMPEFARRFYPATLRLRELLDTTLGRPRLILGHSRLFGFDRYGNPGPTTQMTPAPLMIDPGSYLLDWCGFLFGAAPTTVQGVEGLVLPEAQDTDAKGGPDFESFVLSFPDGGLAQISFGRYHRKAWGEATRFLPSPGFQVYAERGVACVELPDRIQWSDASGVHEERLPLEPTVGEVLNDQFHRLVTGGESLAPTIRDALTVARLVGDVGKSQREGQVRPTTVAD
jgi:predicted dehydrogenase